ncbi:ABC transporter permease subunit [Actinoplanes sp. RD1]|uniref:ABC transporter permease subunit n=1 Tax=Actinoplanes sp. RD1 TaxID=3064538 RepID=UPI00274119DC|nr:ABC transporter permease subunit [Actinoplanes sp. RD1]
MRLVRAELLKIRTTSTWWVFGLVFLALWALTLAVNWFATSVGLDAGGSVEVDPATGDFVMHESDIAANLYTNGQFFGVLVVMLLAAIVVTSEYFQQTATTTFLQTPRRELVVAAKLLAAVLVGLAFWLVSTILNLIFGALILTAYDAGTYFGSGAVWQAVLLNALAYALWAVFGVGAGVLIRSQIGATVTLSVVYVLGYLGSNTFFLLIGDSLGSWFPKLQVLIPPLASQLLVSGASLPGQPPRWLGAVVLILYAVVAGAVGTVITRKRDIT